MTAALVTISPEAGLAVDTLVVDAVGRDAAGATIDLGQQAYAVAGAAWPQTVAVVAGARYAAGADVQVIALAGGLEVGRGGAVVAFRSGATVDASVTVRAACRGVVCEGRSFCGAGGACQPAARRLDFALSVAAAGDQTAPDVTSLGPTGFVAVWLDGATTPAQVRLRRFDPGGLPRDAAEVEVDASPLVQSAPVVAGAPGAGHFVVAWSEAGAGVRLRRFDAGGAALGAADAPAPAASADQTVPALGATDQDFLMAWQDAETPTLTGSAIRYRRAMWLGDWMETAAGYAAQVPTSAESAPAVAAGCGSADTYLVAWEDAGTTPSQIQGRWLGEAPADEGTLSATPAQGDNLGPAGAPGVIVWDDFGPAGGPRAIRLRWCSGALLGAAVLVAAPSGVAPSRPAVGVSGGVALAAWESDDDGAGTVIRARRLDSSGPVDAASFRVAQARFGAQARPRVAGTAAGFLVVWQELGADGAAGGWGVRARFIGAADAP